MTFAKRVIAAILLMAGLAVTLTTATGGAVLAQSGTAPSMEQAWEQALAARTDGPADVNLGAQGVLHVPPEHFFIPRAEAAQLMLSWGNTVGPEFMGLITAKSDQETWFMTVSHVAEGYVKDEEAANWDTDALLSSLKAGTAEQNKLRTEMGIPALDVTGWIEAPQYDAVTHRLVWSLGATERGAPAGTPSVVNYNTYALGRDGYFQMNLLTDSEHVAADKTQAAILLAALEYNQGKRYEDFIAGRDNVAAYGIAALIGGVAAKKLGLLAVIGVFLAKFAKVGIIAVVGAGAVLARVFRRGGGGQA